MIKAVKEIIIMLVVCLLAMLAFIVGLYQFRPNGKTIPEISRYVATEEVQDLLEDNIDKKDDKDNIVLTYEVTSGDLKNYQKSNTYVPGKSNPFAPYEKSTKVEDDEDNKSESSTNNSKTSSKSNEDEKDEAPSVYENKGTK